ncbi:FUSC family protein [Microbacterium ulmi]|uniref:FUSC family protein n=1 Tax=Microbacterium ulmi TaxID=179095 RepID=A0A7Y2LZT8_9MICO|nr:FUSC family protein [Microbacterium ulmi]NII68907.1 hypothetical protein [Microbacterium ulmi]NNH03891.1 FUSC family protein [Microbacterium ulmi]
MSEQRTDDEESGERGTRRGLVSDWLRGLVAIAPAPHARWPIGLQAAFAMAVPLLLFTLLGLPEVGLQAAGGAFTALYAAACSAKERVRVLPFVGAGLIASAALGTVAGADPVVAVVGLIVVSIVAAALVYGFALGPPGPVFFVLVYGLSAHVTAAVDGRRAVEPLAFLGALALGCAFAYLAALSPLVVPRLRREPARRVHEILPGPRLDADARLLLVRVAIVAVVGAVGAALWVDPQHAYWAVCSGLAVVGVNVGRRAAFVRGTQRLVGTLVGAAVFAESAALAIPPLALPLLLGGLQFVIEILVVRNYALALVFITPLVLFITTTAAPGADPSGLIAARVLDTVIGAAIGALSGLLHPRRDA